MGRDIIASGKLTVKDMFSFLFYHNYSSIGGKLTGVLGVVSLILAPLFFFGGDKISGIVFVVVALMYVVITPLDFYSKALRQLKTNPVFKNKMTFMFRPSCIRTTMYTGVTELQWNDIVKIVSVKEYFYIYIKEAHALIVPKRHFPSIDDVEQIDSMIKDLNLDVHKKKRLGEILLEEEIDQIIDDSITEVEEKLESETIIEADGTTDAEDPSEENIGSLLEDETVEVELSEEEVLEKSGHVS